MTIVAASYRQRLFLEQCYRYRNYSTSLPVRNSSLSMEGILQTNKNSNWRGQHSSYIYRFSRLYSRNRMSTAASSRNDDVETMRIAVIGGGVGGLSSALHLAPLVSQGYVGGPIDVYESNATRKGHQIGVGIWSTALDGFRNSDRESHQFVWKEMTRLGSWIGKVGYRTPKGSWLLTSQLPCAYTGTRGGDDDKETTDSDDLPSLLFLREMDLLSTLQKAVKMEQDLGTVQLHDKGNQTFVSGVCDQSTHPWSAPLLLGGIHDEPLRTSNRDYHFIVGAGGMRSIMRKTYGGFKIFNNPNRQRLTGTIALQERPTSSPTIEDDKNMKNKNENETTENESTAHSWLKQNQEEATSLEDRNYSVFRGNAPLTSEQINNAEKISFQTWGESHNMRFALVPMNTVAEDSCGGKEEEAVGEKQVWFITIDDDNIVSEQDPHKRHQMLLQRFESWHEPIYQIVKATPPDEILMERAIAHKHSMNPIMNMNIVLTEKNASSSTTAPAVGHGPALVFVGDAFMTIDPILAQGFSVAMEGAKSLSLSLQETFEKGAQKSAPMAGSESNATMLFDPIILRRKLMKRHNHEMERLVCLLRITEIVQLLGQTPQSQGLFGFFNKNVIRPITYFAPNFIKQPLFDWVLKYSLGLTSKSSKRSTSSPSSSNNQDSTKINAEIQDKKR